MAVAATAIPPHRPLSLPGVHAYSDAKSVRAGEEIAFLVSSDVPYAMSVFKPRHTDDEDEADRLHNIGAAGARVQPIHPGSYIHVAEGLAANRVWDEFAVEIWVSPWVFGRRQTIISQADFPAHVGFALSLDKDGAVSFTIGDGGSEKEATTMRAGGLATRTWHHLVGTWNGSTATLWVDGMEAGSATREGVFRGGSAPIRIGAVGNDGMADHCADADIALPVLYARCLDGKEIARRFAERARHAPVDRFVIGCWPLHEQRGDRAHDSSGHQRTGHIVNNAAWMINGPAFEVPKVDLFGDAAPAYSPLSDPGQGRAIRFARDALYDCRWEETHRVAIPASARPGIYVARLRFSVDGVARKYDVTFVVTRAVEAPTAPLLVLCATNTWLAYSTSSFADSTDLESVWPRRGMGLKNSHAEAPRFSSYTAHHAGQPAYYVGLRMPWPNASPMARYDPPEADFGQWARLELELHFWLDAQGYDYDVVSDLDLHRDPAMLARYRVVMVNGHSEYWSTPSYDGFDRYLREGGSAIVLSGNTLSGRVSFDDDGAIMEQRHTQIGVGFVPGTTIEYPGGKHGEQFHSQDWARGGLIRRADRSSAFLFGLETAGWAFATARDFGVYEVADAEHFLLRTPQPVGLARGESFGHGPGGALPRAVGHEWDLTLGTLRAMAPVMPEGATMPDDQQGIQIIARGVRRERGALDAYVDYFVRDVEPIDDVCCEMIYWERPEGGRVFNAGAVGASLVLSVDPKFARLVDNVLHHFGVAPASRPA